MTRSKISERINFSNIRTRSWDLGLSGFSLYISGECTAGFIVSLRVPLDRFIAHNVRSAARIEFLIIRSTSTDLRSRTRYARVDAIIVVDNKYLRYKNI